MFQMLYHEIYILICFELEAAAIQGNGKLVVCGNPWVRSRSGDAVAHVHAGPLAWGMDFTGECRLARPSPLPLRAAAFKYAHSVRYAAHNHAR